jgi:hypothetical protein
MTSQGKPLRVGASRACAAFLCLFAPAAPATGAGSGAAAGEPAKPAPVDPAAAGGANPFDPKGYIDQQETKAQEALSSLSARAVYRINGQRYQMFQAGQASVWLPSVGGAPEIRKESALCEEHLKLMREVLPLREELPVDAEVKKHEPEIVDLIRMCREGLIKSPLLTVTKPDGAVVEIKAREKEDGSVQSPEEGGSSATGGRPDGVEASFRTPGSGK